MNSGLSRGAGLGPVAVAALTLGVAGCGPTPSHAAATTGTPLRNMSGIASGGGACVFVKPDGAQKLGHVGRGFRITGTNQWEYGAVENPTDKPYTPPGGDIGAWHTTGSYARMLSDMSRDALPRSRLRRAAQDMVRQVEGRGFLVGIAPRTGKLTSRDCLRNTAPPPGRLRNGGTVQTDQVAYRPSSTSNSPASRIALTAVR
ncbi:hypothetical protein [Streptomyces sp. NPDC088350]|uniref:hypothetical protein n=1 Tax=Streptomyces sp. NPDC088350 TaxID=3365854 RepID=UPI0037FC7D0E